MNNRKAYVLIEGSKECASAIYNFLVPASIEKHILNKSVVLIFDNKQAASRSLCRAFKSISFDGGLTVSANTLTYKDANARILYGKEETLIINKLNEKH